MPQLQVTPTTLTRGVTSDLHLNCSITEADMLANNVTSVSSITISRRRSWSRHFTDFASVETCCGKSPKIDHSVVKSPTLVKASAGNTTSCGPPHFLYVDIQSPGDVGGGGYTFKCEVKGYTFGEVGPTVTLTSAEVVVNETAPRYVDDKNGSLVSIQHNLQAPESAQTGAVSVSCNVSVADLQRRFGAGTSLTSLSMSSRLAPGTLFSVIVDETGRDRVDRFVGLPTRDEVTGRINNAKLPYISYRMFPDKFDDVKGEYWCTAVLNTTSSSGGYVQLRSTEVAVSKIELHMSPDGWMDCGNPATITAFCQISNEIRERYIPTINTLELMFARGWVSTDKWTTIASADDGESFSKTVDLGQSAVITTHRDPYNATGQVHVGATGAAAIRLQLHMKPDSCFDGGYYRCRATGLDTEGNTVELSSTRVSQLATFIVG